MRELLARLSPEERHAVMSQIATRRKRAPKACAVCGALIPAAFTRQRYCSAACSQRAYRQRQRGRAAEGAERMDV